MATAFAVYSADDNSLNFYKRDTVPTADSSFDGRTATVVYTGIETDVYDDSTQPWSSYRSSIASVSFVDEGIAPISTAWWFYGMNNASLTTMDLSKLNTSNVTDTSVMFHGCTSLTSLDVSGWNTSKVTIMSFMFFNCSALTTIYVGDGWSTASVAYSDSMFDYCSKLPNFNSSVVDKTNAHYNSGGYLTPLGITYYVWSGTGINASYYTCEAYRYVKSNGTVVKQSAAGTITRDAYTADSVTLTATFSEDWAAATTKTLTKSTFAVYSADDNSLNFYKRIAVTSAGSSFNGKTATAVYTGIETDVYDTNTNDTDGAIQLPWYSNRSSITSVSIVDEGITPVSTAHWFNGMNNTSLTAIGGLDKLNTSSVTNMSYMFANCTALTILDVSGFNTSSVTNMSCMFGTCSALASLDVSGFDTANVTDMSHMLANCSALTNIYAGDGWSIAKVTSSSGMFTSCSNLPNYNSSVEDKTNAHAGEGGYLTYRRYISPADKVKVILEKGAVDIIVNTIKEIESSIPAYTSADEGKFLRVVNGAPAWISIQNAEGASF